MQLHLEMDELNLLANILLQRLRTLSAGASSDPPPGSDSTKRDLQNCNDLLDKVLARDLRFDTDELEQLADLVAAQKRLLDAHAARLLNAEPDLHLQQQRALLDRVMEKVDECCAMF